MADERKEYRLSDLPVDCGLLFCLFCGLFSGHINIAWAVACLLHLSHSLESRVHHDIDGLVSVFGYLTPYG